MPHSFIGVNCSVPSQISFELENTIDVTDMWSQDLLVSLTCDGICGLYERKIRNINPMVRNFTYDITDLHNFIDGLTDISALVYDHSLHAFLPYDRQWIKQKMFQHLKKLAQQ